MKVWEGNLANYHVYVISFKGHPLIKQRVHLADGQTFNYECARCQQGVA